jgi:hypothetical protein
VEENLRVVAIVASDLGPVDDDVADLALVGVIEQLGEADVLFLTGRRCS